MTESNHSIFDRVSSIPPQSLKWFSRTVLRSQERQFRKEIERDLARMRREDDPEKNVKSAPPPSERVELHSILTAECYTPSHLDELVRRISSMGSAERGAWFSGGRESIDDWIRAHRESSGGGAWRNLGRIVHRKDAQHWFGTEMLPSDLPELVDYADASLHHPVPSLFVLTIQFVLRDEVSKDINEVLHRHYQTSAVKRGRGYTYRFPADHKQDAIEAIRGRARSQVASWVRNTLPGAFSTGAGPAEFPMIEVITTDIAKPFQDQSPRRDMNFLAVLGIDRDFNVWKSSWTPGFGLLVDVHRRPSAPLHLVLAGNTTLVSAVERFERSGETTRERITNILVDQMSGTMCLWAIHGLLSRYESHLASLRDAMAQAARKPSRFRQSSTISVLESAVIALSGDMITVQDELEAFASEAYRFNHNIPGWTPVHDQFWKIKSPPVHSTWLRRLRDRWSDGQTDAAPPELPNLTDWIRESTVRRCQYLRRTEAAVRQLIVTSGSIATARTGMQLQWVVFALTFVATITGVAEVTEAISPGSLQCLAQWIADIVRSFS